MPPAFPWLKRQIQSILISKIRYALPYAAPHVAYAHAPFVYNALDTGLVYPVAEAYVHDAAGELLALTTDKAGKKAEKT